MSDVSDQDRAWFVYILRCKDNSLYTGITTDPTRRLKEHNSTSGGARYTRTRQPVHLVYKERAHDRSAALTREYQIKQLSKSQKEQLITTTKMHSPTPKST